MAVGSRCRDVGGRDFDLWTVTAVVLPESLPLLGLPLLLYLKGEEDEDGYGLNGGDGDKLGADQLKDLVKEKMFSVSSFVVAPTPPHPPAPPPPLPFLCSSV